MPRIRRFDVKKRVKRNSEKQKAERYQIVEYNYRKIKNRNYQRIK